MNYTRSRIVVKALSGEVVVERAIDAFLADKSGLAYHLALEQPPAEGEGDTDPQAQLYTVTHIPTGCAIGALPIRGESFACEALERIARLAEQFPDRIEWSAERPFATEEIAWLAGRLIHWIMSDVYARSKLAARRKPPPASLPAPSQTEGGRRRKRAANTPPFSERQ